MHNYIIVMFGQLWLFVSFYKKKKETEYIKMLQNLLTDKNIVLLQFIVIKRQGDLRLFDS